jgi:predicted GIY-YIG superfamily endonuclease
VDLWSINYLSTYPVRYIMTLACESSNTEFKPISNSNIHKEITKNCLPIQGVSPKEYPCETCEKKFKTRKGKETHLLKCLQNRQTIKTKCLTKKKPTTQLEQTTESLPGNTVDNQPTINEQNEKVSEELTTCQAQPSLIHNDTFKIKLLNGIFLDIGIRKDGYINATHLCKAGGKLFGHYKDSKQTQDYLQALSHNIGIPILDLLDSKVGGSHSGTYVHRKVAYHLAQWISPHFAVQVSNILDELILTGKVELGKEKSSAELDNIYETRIQELNDKLKRYECSLFNRDVDVCPVEFFGKDVIYFLRYKVPEQLLTTYSSIYPNITNKEFACIEFGITSNLEQRLQTHKKDKRKNEVIFTHAFKLDKRYTASKLEYYVKTIAKQLGVNFEYERSKESILVNEVTFNVMLNRIKEGIDSIEPCADIEVGDSVDNSVEDSVKDIPKLDIRLELRRLELNHELEFEKHNMTLELEKHNIELDLELEKQKIELENKKHQRITDLMKNDKITFEQYTELLRKI